MDGKETKSYTNMEKLAVNIGMALAEFTSAVRAIGETLGIVKVQPLGGKRPEGSKLWENVKNIPKRMIGTIDRLAGIEQKEKGKPFIRSAIIALIAVPIAIIAFNIWSLASNAKPAQEKKPREKTAPAPRKAEGVRVHANDAFYKMAFARPLPKNTFAISAQKRQPAQIKLA